MDREDAALVLVTGAIMAMALMASYLLLRSPPKPVVDSRSLEPAAYDPVYGVMERDEALRAAEVERA